MEPKLWNKRSASLLAGSSLQAIGAWIDFLAILTLAAYEYKASPYLMAGISALLLGPAVLLSSRAGRLVDGPHTGRVLIACLLLRTVATGLLLLSPSLVGFCLIVAFRSVVTVPVEPANNVMVKRMIEKTHVQQYFGMLAIARNTSKIGAPLIGAVVASIWGEHAAIFISITLTFAACVCLTGVRHTAAVITSPVEKKALTEQVRPSAGDAVSLSKILMIVTTFALMVFMINNQLPVLLHSAGFDKALLGILVSCSGFGGIVAAAYVSRKKIVMISRDPQRTTVLSIYAVAAIFVALGFAFLLPATWAQVVAPALFFCTGICASIEAISANTLVVQRFEDRVGSVTGKIQTFQSGAMLIAPWLAALMVEFLSMQMLFITCGLLGMCALFVVNTVSLPVGSLGVPPTRS